MKEKRETLFSVQDNIIFIRNPEKKTLNHMSS
jgi:hypothetical protein